MMKLEPYFMKNEEWYYFDEKDFMYKLTNKAPKEAVKSYKEFYDYSKMDNDLEDHKLKQVLLNLF